MEQTTTQIMIEEQEDMAMVSLTGGDPFHKKAYFLKPFVPLGCSIDHPPLQLKLPHYFPSLPSIFDPKELPLQLQFRGWRLDHKDLQTWVDHLAPVHQSTWKKAGIYEAIFNSTYRIRKQTDLVIALAEKWCTETNTFIFPWGEATITLEDVMILGGFSVSGDSTFSLLEREEEKEMEDKLEEERKGLYDYSAGCKTADTNEWLKKFKYSGKELEHIAFLVFWLSRYVFHYARNLVNRAVFSITIRLAMGTRIALAPAVLASICRDLTLLKKKFVSSTELKAMDGVIKLVLKSPFHLVQVWGWERFLELRPKPNVIKYGQQRLSRWDNLTGVSIKCLRSVLDSAGEEFQWRPYALPIQNWKLPNYCRKEEQWVSVGPDLNDDELLSFCICLRVSQLVGFDTIEQYLPHRVSLQFGYDQDIPSIVALSNQSSDIALENYFKELKSVKLYVPSRLSEGDATVRYLKWWKKSVAGLKEESTIRNNKAKKVTKAGDQEMNNAAMACSPNIDLEDLVHITTGSNEGNDSLVPPKRNRQEAGDDMDEDELSIVEALEKRKKHKTVESREGTNSEKLPGPDQILASSIADEGSSVSTEKMERSEKKVPLIKALIWGGKGKRKMRPTTSISSLFEKRGSGSSISSFEERVSVLKAKVSKLAKVVQVLKINTFGNKCTSS